MVKINGLSLRTAHLFFIFFKKNVVVLRKKLVFSFLFHFYFVPLHRNIYVHLLRQHVLCVIKTGKSAAVLKV